MARGRINHMVKRKCTRYRRMPLRLRSNFSDTAVQGTINRIRSLSIDPAFQNNHILLVNALKKLKTISELEDNWNDNGAKHFEKGLLVQCYVILTTLERFPPEIFPVADGSIQFEFEKSDGSYLEFDIFENEVSEYRIYPDGKEVERIVDKNKVSEEVNSFYEQSDK